MGLLDQRLFLNLAAFHNKYKDIQLSVFTAYDSNGDGTDDAFFGDFTNAGSGTVQGLEVEYQWLPNQNWRDQAPAFPAIYTITNVWKGFGFGSILYISSITSIDQSQYESARIDGANRGQQCWYITLPGIKNIIAINLILAIGGILGTNSDLILLLYSPATYDVADVIGTYTYRIGIEGGQYSYTAAAGLFMSVIGFVLTYIANKVSDKLTGFGLW